MTNVMAYLDSNKQVYIFNGSVWIHAVGEEGKNFVDVTVGAGNVVYALDAQGFIHQYTGNAWLKDANASNVTKLWCDQTMNLWCTNKTGSMYMLRNGAFWQEIWKNIPALAQQPPTGGYWEYVVKGGQDWLWQIIRNNYPINPSDNAAIDRLVTWTKQLNPNVIKDWDNIPDKTKLKMPPR